MATVAAIRYACVQPSLAMYFYNGSNMLLILLLSIFFFLLSGYPCAPMPEQSVYSAMAVLDREISHIFEIKIPDEIAAASRKLREDTELINRRKFLVGSSLALGSFLKVAGANENDNFISEGKYYPAHCMLLPDFHPPY